jgi:hypothetical protein
MIDNVMRFPEAAERDPDIDTWLSERTPALGTIAQHWFAMMRRCGNDLRELMHDGCPVACVGDVAFGYVNVFTSHVNVGFYNGALLKDPAKLLLGTGKRMRHVKLKPGEAVDAAALEKLITASYREARLHVTK